MKKIVWLLIAFFVCGCAGNILPKPFKNWKQLKEKNVVMQGFDYSCGTGALSTLLTYYFNDPVSEIELIKDILNHLPEEVSLLFGLHLLFLHSEAASRLHNSLNQKTQLHTPFPQ